MRTLRRKIITPHTCSGSIFWAILILTKSITSWLDRTSQIPVNRTRRKRLHTSLYENSMGDALFQREVHWTHNCSPVVDPGEVVSGPVHQICGFFFFFRYLSAKYLQNLDCILLITMKYSKLICFEIVCILGLWCK